MIIKDLTPFTRRGADKLSGGADNDKLLGGADNDTLNGDAGKDELYGGAGNDRLLGGSEADTLYGDFKDPDANSADSGDDTLVGGDGIDTLYGGQGNDTLYGDQESEASLEAFGWGDTLYGGKGNDILYGGSGNDRLEGGEGDDTITGGAGNDILMGGEGIDIYKFGSAADYFGKDTITDSDGKGSLQINGQTLGGTFTSYGERGAYRLKLADGSSAGLSVYNDSASSTGKSAILKFSGNLTNQITIRNFDEAAAKGGQGFMGIKINPKQAVLVKASDYSTAPNPFQPWDFNPNTFAAGADSAITERNGKSFTVYLQQAASASSTLILNIAGAVQGFKAKDKINGLAGSDLLGGFGGNDEIDGGSGADMIGGGKGSDNIKGGDGDDYISSSADVLKSQQQRGKDDVWQNYGLPQGKEAISTQALWGIYKDTRADGDGVTIWAGITETDTSRTEGDVIDAGAGDDWVIASWGDDRVKGGEGKDQIEGLAGDDIIDADSLIKVGYLNSTDADNHRANFCNGEDGDTSHYKFRSCLRPYLLVKSSIRYLISASKSSPKACVSHKHARGSIRNTPNSIASCSRKQGVTGIFDGGDAI